MELVPQITKDGRSFAFASAEESRGHARKTTGSYYTPDELVQLLLTSALDQVVKRTIGTHPDRAAEALLELAIVDPACGSGHFLLAAARRLADHVARIRSTGTPTPDDYQRALRDVVRRCIYGVDMNPLAVELCKVSLWMESIDPGPAAHLPGEPHPVRQLPDRHHPRAHGRPGAGGRLGGSGGR